MTAQISERLIYEGQQLAICTNPLSLYFAMGGDSPNFEDNCTALWRGYVGTWEIVDGRLYLIKLQGTLEGGGEASVATIFPDYPDRVFAHWYSGTIRIPQGKLLNYVHMGYSSTYERDLFLEIEKGIIKKTRVRYNGHAKGGDGPEGYGIGGMTVFPRAQVEGEAP
jgi:hypothetical protein